MKKEFRYGQFVTTSTNEDCDEMAKLLLVEQVVKSELVDDNGDALDVNTFPFTIGLLSSLICRHALEVYTSIEVVEV